jgi:hypothetical protein
MEHFRSRERRGCARGVTTSHDGLSPSGPMVREPHPEETIEAPELRSLRSTAEQGKLLPERQVLEREVGAGSERRAQGAQQSEYEGHWPHGSHAACPSSSLGREFWQTTAPVERGEA